MELSCASFTFFACVFIFSFFPLSPVGSTFPSHPFHSPKCHGYERSALLEFKQSLTINKSSSSSIYSYPKVLSWKPEGEKGDCCSWDGVQCDNKTGHVVALDLSSSCLYGSINSSNSLFRLVHLQILNLSDNDFDYSEIPSGIGSLMELRSLNLSVSAFSGEIPWEISKLKKLVLLDLSWNYLLLQKSSLQFLIQNMASIEILDLSWVKISSEIPAILSNFTSLKSLSLRDCQLKGQIPEELLHLPNLRRLNLMYNENITGLLPHFSKNSPLQVMWLAATGLSGELPSSIGNLGSLLELDLYGCKFSGSIPPQLGNLTHLQHLQLSFNSFTSQIPLSIGNLADLRSVILCDNLLTGQIPPVFTNFHYLQNLSLCGNNFTGPFPPSLANLSRLVHLDLSDNNFYGSISESVFSLKNLAYLDLSGNTFTGSVDFEEFNALKNLTVLNLSGNQLSLVVDDSSNQASSSTSIHKFQHLGLSQCNLRKVPAFLRNQYELKWLDLSNNSIHGGIPEWMLNIGKETLDYINFSHNFFTGFSSLQVLPWSRLTYLDLSFNVLQGSIPIPPFSLLYFSVAKNVLTGEIPPAICSMTSLNVLDLSYNNFTGEVPPCLSSFSDSLTVLNLRRNNFHGIIPQTWKVGSMLQMISFSENNFHGKIPKKLINCARLKILDLSNNNMRDEFPSWLGVLPELKLLNLRSNEFHGKIKHQGRVGHDHFPNLCIIDLACNDFTGKIPSEIFNGWKAMKNNSPEDFLTYIEVGTTMSIFQFTLIFSYDYSMAVTNKGVQFQYDKLSELFTVIDLSNNALEGEVPEIIGALTSLRSLNLSYNLFSGYIPSSLGNLKNLESLDLSNNEFSGKIPQNLNQLTFLGFFNVSNNNLAGSIPHGNQLDTFQSSSYEGNPKLCGPPLRRRCINLAGNSRPPPPGSVEENRVSESLLEYGWKFCLIGYGFGLIMGHFVEFFLSRTMYSPWAKKIRNK